MSVLPLKKQKEAKKLRKAGWSHRDIAERLNIALGSAFKYSRQIRLSPEQHLKLKRRNINHLRLSHKNQSHSKMLEARRRGGRNTPSKFKPKYSRRDLLKLIEDFAETYGRTPTKREFIAEYRAFLRVFGTWNNAIKAAGLAPNPVRFAHKFIANDGHKCDSLSEKIIDDWLNARKIEHKINVPYPGNNRFTADFVVGNYWIEFFGLSGEHERYDELKKQKVGVAKDHALDLIEIYPQDLFPEFKLEERLAILLIRA